MSSYEPLFARYQCHFDVVAVATQCADGVSRLAGTVAAYGDRILAVDVLAAARAGRLEAKAIAAGHDPGMADATIAGIAQAHNLVIITDNMRDFQVFGSNVVAPGDVTR